MRQLQLNRLPDFDEFEIVRGQLSNAPDGGFDLDGIRSSLRLVDALEAANSSGAIGLEEKDYAYLQVRMRTARWAVADARLVDLIERCLNAPTA